MCFCYWLFLIFNVYSVNLFDQFPLVPASFWDINTAFPWINISPVCHLLQYLGIEGTKGLAAPPCQVTNIHAPGSHAVQCRHMNFSSQSSDSASTRLVRGIYKYPNQPSKVNCGTSICLGPNLMCQDKMRHPLTICLTQFYYG